MTTPFPVLPNEGYGLPKPGSDALCHPAHLGGLLNISISSRLRDREDRRRFRTGIVATCHFSRAICRPIALAIAIFEPSDFKVGFRQRGSSQKIGKVALALADIGRLVRAKR